MVRCIGRPGLVAAVTAQGFVVPEEMLAPASFAEGRRLCLWSTREITRETVTDCSFENVNMEGV